MATSLHPGDFVRGFLYPLRGLSILRRHKGLARFWLPPIVLTTAALATSITFAVRHYDDAVELLWRTPVQANWVVSALHGLLSVVAFVVGIGLAMVVSVLFANLIAAPFNDALSETVEELETGQPAPPFSFARLVRDLARTLRVELGKLLLYAAIMVPLWLLSWLVPGIGQLLYLVVGSLFTAIYFAIDYTDWPASRRGMALRERARYLRVRPLMTLGFGFAVGLCLFVPILNLCFMPLAVAGGTRLFLDLEAYVDRKA